MQVFDNTMRRIVVIQSLPGSIHNVPTEKCLYINNKMNNLNHNMKMGMEKESQTKEIDDLEIKGCIMQFSVFYKRVW